MKHQFSLKNIAFYLPISPFEFKLVTYSYGMMDCLAGSNDILSNTCIVGECWELLMKALFAVLSLFYYICKKTALSFF